MPTRAELSTGLLELLEQEQERIANPTEVFNQQAGTYLDCGLSDDCSEIERPNKKLRGASWAEWEDKALAIQVLADNPISNKIGKKEKRWRTVSDNLRRLVGIDRTWSSCVDRMDRLIAQHKV